MPGAQIFNHLVRLQHIRPDLIAPARIALAFMGFIDGSVAAIKLHLVEPRFQRFHSNIPILVLGFF